MSLTANFSMVSASFLPTKLGRELIRLSICSAIVSESQRARWDSDKARPSRPNFVRPTLWVMSGPGSGVPLRDLDDKTTLIVYPFNSNR
jgi:hypothetical protein